MPATVQICCNKSYFREQLSVTCAAAVVLGCCISGCSCSKRPEWDSGLRETTPRPAVKSGGAAPQGSAEAGGSRSGRGSGDGQGEGGAGGSSSGEGEGAGGVESGAGTGGTGSGGNGAGSASTEGPGDGGGQQGSPVAGKEADGKEGGTGDDPSLPPAALPGRPRPKPRYDAKAAAEVAERKLRQADSNRSDGDLANSYTAALEAFEAVEPHAEADTTCRQLLARAKRLLAEVAEKQNRKTAPRALPTLFE